MTDPLYSCPRCERRGFTKSGLSHHVCRGSIPTSEPRWLNPAELHSAQPLSIQITDSGSLSPMPDSIETTIVALKPVNLETLDGEQLDQKRNSFVFDANSLTQRVQAMFANLDGLQKERAIKAVLCGLYLAEIRAKTPHGEFIPWMHQNFPSSVRKAQYYIQLAGKFAKSSKLLLPELIAAEQISLQLTSEDATAQTVMAKLEKFVGHHGLTELLQRHGVVKRGGARTPSAPALPAPAGEDQPPTPEPTPADGPAIAFENFFNAIKTAEKVLLSDLNWSLIDTDKAALAEATLKSMAESYHERLLRLRHESAA